MQNSPIKLTTDSKTGSKSLVTESTEVLLEVSISNVSFFIFNLLIWESFLTICTTGLLEAPKAEDESQISLESKHFYLSCVNISQIVKIGDKPLRSSLENLGGRVGNGDISNVLKQKG